MNSIRQETIAVLVRGLRKLVAAFYAGSSTASATPGIAGSLSGAQCDSICSV